MSPPVRLAAPTDLDAVSRLFDEYRVFYELASDIDLASDFIAERFKNAQEMLDELTALVTADQ